LQVSQNNSRIYGEEKKKRKEKERKTTRIAADL
jgi:hypothetical protein